MTNWDHALALAFGILFPMISLPVYERRRPALREGVEEVRSREYRDTILWLAGMGICTLAVWIALGRPLADLGLRLTWSTPVMLATALVAAVLALFAYQLRLIRADPRARDSVRAQLTAVSEFMPISDREARLFNAVAVSAGVGEELFYRGFLIWYLDAAIPLPAAVAVSTLLFGLAHVVHGAGATVRATILGLIFALGYLWTLTLWIPIVLHTAIDWFAGRAAFESRVSTAG